ncbi:MAG: trypsin-like serine protease, partial [Planctomycetota bacterium]
MAAALAASGVAAGTIGQPQFEDVYDALGQAEAFEPVGSFTGTTSTGSYAASGVYLGDGWVVTAAHVVDSAESLAFTVGGETYEAQAWAYHVDWDPNDVLAGADIAMVYLGDDLNLDVDAALLYTGETQDLVGELAVSTGYGLTGTGASGYDPASGTDTKHAGTNTIDMIYGDDVLISDLDSGAGWHSPTGSSSPTTLEYLIAPGDSGGGVFVYDDNLDDWALAGINSFGLGLDGETDSDFGDLSGQVSIAYYDDWVYQVMTLGDDGLDSDALDGVYGDAVFSFALTPEPS